MEVFIVNNRTLILPFLNIENKRVNKELILKKSITIFNIIYIYSIVILLIIFFEVSKLILIQLSSTS